MATQASTQGLFFRLGGVLAACYAAMAAGEHHVVRWFVSNGLPAELGWVAAWAIRLALVAALLYVAFWLALLVGLLIVVARVPDDASSAEEDAWPFMTQEELRASMFYDPILHNDVSHEQFKDD